MNEYEVQDVGRSHDERPTSGSAVASGRQGSLKRQDAPECQRPLGRPGPLECQDSPEWMTRYRDFKSLCADVSGEYIRFYLTTGCEQIDYAHSQNTDGLPSYSCRLASTDGAVFTLTLDDWRSRLGEVPEVVRAWLGDHSNLRGCKPAKSHYQGDRYWLKRWQLANPW